MHSIHSTQQQLVSMPMRDLINNQNKLHPRTTFNGSSYHSSTDTTTGIVYNDRNKLLIKQISIRGNYRRIFITFTSDPDHALIFTRSLYEGSVLGRQTHYHFRVHTVAECS